MVSTAAISEARGRRRTAGCLAPRHCASAACSTRHVQQTKYVNSKKSAATIRVHKRGHGNTEHFNKKQKNSGSTQSTMADCGGAHHCRPPMRQRLTRRPPMHRRLWPATKLFTHSQRCVARCLSGQTWRDGHRRYKYNTAGTLTTLCPDTPHTPRLRQVGSVPLTAAIIMKALRQERHEKQGREERQPWRSAACTVHRKVPSDN